MAEEKQVLDWGKTVVREFNGKIIGHEYVKKVSKNRVYLYSGMIFDAITGRSVTNSKNIIRRTTESELSSPKN